MFYVFLGSTTAGTPTATAPRRDVDEHDGVGSNAGPRADDDASQNLGAGADFDPGAEAWRRRVRDSVADGHLLEQQAVWPDFRIRMDDHPIGMRQHQSAAQPAIERDIGAGHHAPESVAEVEIRTAKCASMPPFCAASADSLE